MTDRPRSPGETEAEQVKACLARILSTDVFAQSERQKRLLTYLVSETLEGRGDRLKGYSIAMAVFDRGADFDPTTEPIVRVEAARLRGKLREYYEREGRADPLRIEIPKGSYVVHINGSTGGDERQEPRREPSQAKPSIAVLPFTNLSDDPRQDYFADGIAEDLITDLSKLSGLLVISRHSSFLYKGCSKPAAVIADELGVRCLVEGSVRRSDDRVRIAASLIDAATGAQIWAERYDRELRDIFAVQDDVARRIVKSLQIKLVGAESDRLGHEGTSSAEAHDKLLRGLERFWKYEGQAVKEAVQYFEEALSIDPQYAAAHAWLARVLMFIWALVYADEGIFNRAFNHALKAVALDDQLPLAQAMLGYIQMWRGKGGEALEAGRRAVTLDPNDADARVYLSLILHALGRAKEGLQYVRSAIRLNPHPSTFYLFALGVNYSGLGQYEEAVAAFIQGKELNPDFSPNYALLATNSLKFGRTEEALAAWRTFLTLAGGRPAPNSLLVEPQRSDFAADLAELERLNRR